MPSAWRRLAPAASHRVLTCINAARARARHRVAMRTGDNAKAARSRDPGQDASRTTMSRSARGSRAVLALGAVAAAWAQAHAQEQSQARELDAVRVTATLRQANVGHRAL